MKILFMGKKKYAADMLEWTVQQGHDIIAVVADSHNPQSELNKRSLLLDIPLFSYAQAEEMVNKNDNCVDLVISYLFWQKIKEPLISSPRLGCINFHPALLPDWKGVAGYNIAILNKLTEWGASAHIVDEDIDTGPIIEVLRFGFDYKAETAQSLERKTQEIQCILYKQVMTKIKEDGGINGPFIENKGGTLITKKEMLEMMRIQPGDDVALKARAFWFPPFHGAYIEIDGEKFTLVDDLILQHLG